MPCSKHQHLGCKQASSWKRSLPQPSWKSPRASHDDAALAHPLQIYTRTANTQISSRARRDLLTITNESLALLTLGPLHKPLEAPAKLVPTLPVSGWGCPPRCAHTDTHHNSRSRQKLVLTAGITCCPLAHLVSPRCHSQLLTRCLPRYRSPSPHSRLHRLQMRRPGAGLPPRAQQASRNHQTSLAAQTSQPHGWHPSARRSPSPPLSGALHAGPCTKRRCSRVIFTPRQPAPDFAGLLGAWSTGHGTGLRWHAGGGANWTPVRHA